MGLGRYLLEASSKAYIDPSRGHHNIARSCLSYMCTTLIFLDDSQSDTLKKEIVRACHGIHRYAWEHWAYHVLKQAGSGHDAASVVSDDLIIRLRSLSWAQKASTPLTTSVGDAPAASSDTFQGIPEVSEFLSKVLSFRATRPALEQEYDNPHGK